MSENISQATPEFAVDPKELAVAQTEAEAEAAVSDATYTHTFKRPFTYEGTTYDTLTFDFSTLTGADGIAAQEELDRKGKIVVVPATNSNFLCIIAARACTVPLAANVLQAMPLRDFNRITGKARSFLLGSEL